MRERIAIYLTNLDVAQGTVLRVCDIISHKSNDYPKF